MSTDYLPRKDSDLLLWTQNYKKSIATVGVTLGLTAESIAAEQKLCDTIINSITEVESAKAALATMVTHKNEILQTSGGELRTNIGRHKKLPTYTAALGETLQVVSSAISIDVANHKAKITAEIFAGYVRIKFTKQGTDGINLYHRKKGDASWHFLARDTKSPYDDHIVLAAAGQPEHWEYRAYSVINDDEIGQPSDIVEVVYGG